LGIESRRKRGFRLGGEKKIHNGRMLKGFRAINWGWGDENKYTSKKGGSQIEKGNNNCEKGVKREKPQGRVGSSSGVECRNNTAMWVTSKGFQECNIGVCRIRCVH